VILFIPRLIWNLVRQFSILDILKIFLLIPFALWMVYTGADLGETAADKKGMVSSVVTKYKGFFDSGLEKVKGL
jgi:hypothetical protein